MLDRIGLPSLSLGDAARLALVSLDATVRSNLTVGPPLEVATYPTDSFNMGWRAKFRADSAYLQSLAASWQQGLQIAFANLPKFDWEQT
jgi:putative proteasome-type protease